MSWALAKGNVWKFYVHSKIKQNWGYWGFCCVGFSNSFIDEHGAIEAHNFEDQELTKRNIADIFCLKKVFKFLSNHASHNEVRIVFICTENKWIIDTSKYFIRRRTGREAILSYMREFESVLSFYNVFFVWIGDSRINDFINWSVLLCKRGLHDNEWGNFINDGFGINWFGMRIPTIDPDTFSFGKDCVLGPVPLSCCLVDQQYTILAGL